MQAVDALNLYWLTVEPNAGVYLGLQYNEQ